MNTLSYRNCLGLNRPDQKQYLSPPPYKPDTVNQTVDFGGAKWQGQPGGGWSQIAGSPGEANADPLATAQSLQDFYTKANQPAIQTLQGQQSSLQQSYKDLLASVLGQGTVAENQAITGENNLLGQRGITNNSPLYSQQMTGALLPVESQYKSLAANVGQGSAQDLTALAGQIAGLQAGNPSAAISGAINLSSLSQQLPLLQAQTQATGYIPIPGYGVYDMNTKQLIGGLNGIPGQGATNVNGVPSLYIPERN